jgi:hypothetical protein
MKLAIMMNPKRYCHSGCLIRSRAECWVNSKRSGRFSPHRTRLFSVFSYSQFFQSRSVIMFLDAYSDLFLNKGIPLIEHLYILQGKNVLSTPIVAVLSRKNMSLHNLLNSWEKFHLNRADDQCDHVITVPNQFVRTRNFVLRMQEKCQIRNKYAKRVFYQRNLIGYFILAGMRNDDSIRRDGQKSRLPV